MNHAPAATDAVLYEKDGRGVVTLTMNRPANFNALSEEMLAALQSALDRVAADAEARVVVIAGAGKAFCPGHNLKEMIEQPSLAYYQQLFAQCSRVMLSILKLPVPVTLPPFCAVALKSVMTSCAPEKRPAE